MLTRCGAASFSSPKRGDPAIAQGAALGIGCAKLPKPQRSDPNCTRYWTMIVARSLAGRLGSPRWGSACSIATRTPGLRPGLSSGRPIGARRNLLRRLFHNRDLLGRQLVQLRRQAGRSPFAILHSLFAIPQHLLVVRGLRLRVRIGTICSLQFTICSLQFSLFAPSGAIENSPAIYRWVGGRGQLPQVP